MRCLTSWNRVGGFLELDDLLVHEAGAVVYNLHRVLRLADVSRAFGRLGDLATINVNLHSMITNLTSEEGIFHIRDDWCSSDNKSLNSYNLVDICEF